MALPTYEELMLPLLRRTAATPGETSVPDLLPDLAVEFSLTPTQIAERLPSGRQTILANRCHWAQTYMRRAGLLESIRRGRFKVTQRGQELLAERPERIDRSVLARYPEFVAWLEASRGSRDEATDAVTTVEPADVPQATPDEQIQGAYELLKTNLETEVLVRLRIIAPEQFEQIVVDLLIAMGFGAGDPDMGKRLGRSGDGGIDGVIREDALGLDAV